MVSFVGSSATVIHEQVGDSRCSMFVRVLVGQAGPSMNDTKM